MKALTIKSDGTFTFVHGDVQGAYDICHPALSQADQRLFQDEIDTLQAQSLHELHLEKGPSQTFVHKIGKNKFIVENDPDIYNVFTVMDQWAFNNFME